MKTYFSSKKQIKVISVISIIQEWISSIFYAASAATLIRWMLIGLYVIPSCSMEPTLLIGDFVLVSKIHYGARTPVTPLQIPITHQTIPGTRIRSYLDYIKLPQYRLPGLSKIKHNDIIVFNTPIGSEPPDLRDYWIKRCIALPGDWIYITHKKLYINNTLSDLSNRVQYRYFIKTRRILTNAFFEKNDIKNPVLSTIPGYEGYVIYATPEKVNQLITILPTYIQSVDPIEDEIIDNNTSSIYSFNSNFGWTKDNFGPLRVPNKGMIIRMDKQNILLYGSTIKKFEQKNIRFTESTCWINNKKIEYYTFSKNYYFAMGDNRDQSSDSRFIGFIPEDYILGKAIMVLLSSDKNKSFFSGIRWNRLFKLLI